jgi:hypothetical protein
VVMKVVLKIVRRSWQYLDAIWTIGTRHDWWHTIGIRHLTPPILRLGLRSSVAVQVHHVVRMLEAMKLRGAPENFNFRHHTVTAEPRAARV